MADFNSDYTGAQVEALLNKISAIPTPSSSDNGKVLGVSGGAYSLTSPITIYSGSSNPSSSLGNDGDIYIKTS